jgi:hypothetical protein
MRARPPPLISSAYRWSFWAGPASSVGSPAGADAANAEAADLAWVLLEPEPFCPCEAACAPVGTLAVATAKSNVVTRADGSAAAVFTMDVRLSRTGGGLKARAFGDLRRVRHRVWSTTFGRDTFR